MNLSGTGAGQSRLLETDLLVSRNVADFLGLFGGVGRGSLGDAVVLALPYSDRGRWVHKQIVLRDRVGE